MNRYIVLAVMLFALDSGFAQDADMLSGSRGALAGGSEEEKPASQLIQLERILTQAQEDMKRDGIDETHRQDFVAKFRVDLAAALAVVKPTPANMRLHARILSRLGDAEEAQAVLGASLERDPDDSAGRVALSRLLYDNMDYPAALAEANTVLARDPANKDALVLKYSSEGRIGPAMEKKLPETVVDRIIASRAGDNPKVQTLVSNIRDARRSGDMSAALHLAQELMRVDPTSENAQDIYRGAAKDYARTQRGPDAIRGLNFANVTEPASKGGGIPLWPLMPVAGLGAAAYAVSKSRKTVKSEDGFNEDDRPQPGELQRLVAGLTLAGLAGAGIYLGGAYVVGAGAPLAARFMAGPGQQAVRLARSEAGAINPGRTRAANEVPKMLARVIPYNPGSELPPTVGRASDPGVFVTAAEDIAGLNPIQLSQRLGIKPAREFLIIRFPVPQRGLSTPVAFDDPQFIGRGLTSGGAREFMISNGPLPATATFEVVK